MNLPLVGAKLFYSRANLRKLSFAEKKTTSKGIYYAKVKFSDHFPFGIVFSVRR